MTMTYSPLVTLIYRLLMKLKSFAQLHNDQQISEVSKLLKRNAA